MRRKTILIFFYFSLIFIKVYSNDTTLVKSKSWYVPDYAKVQFAGNIGFLSIGTGYSLFNNYLQSDIFYGYVPKSIAGTKIHTISQKNSFTLFQYKTDKYVLASITGFATSFETGNNSFLFLPDEFPKGYYNPNLMHFTFFLGSKVHLPFKNKKLNSIEIYTELGTVDTYLWYKIISKEVNNILSFSFGITLFY